MVLLVVGGGFGPPMLGLALGSALLLAAWGGSSATTEPSRGWRRAIGHRWRLLLVLTVGAFLALFPGVVLLQALAGVETVWLPALLPGFAFAGLVTTLMAASIHDR